jgi:hypothetical protein
MTDQTQDIADIIDRKPVESAPEPAPQEADTGIPRDEHGRFAPKAKAEAEPQPAPEPTGVTAAPPAAPSQPPEGYVPLAALVDQRLEARQHRQQAEELRKQLEELRKPKAEPVDFYADPDAAFNQRLQEALSPFQSQLQEARTALFEERLYRIAGGEKAAKIEEELTKAMEAGEPEVMALSHALRSQGLAAVKSLVDWYDNRPEVQRERLRSELEAEILAKHGIKPGEPPQAQPQPAPVMPSNLAGARNVGNRAGPKWSGPPKLEDIFKR